MSVLAIITARGGSKRIPRKNIRNFMGRPMITYAISVALEASLFDEVMVSTDDDEIAALARVRGAAVPFMRSAATANDYATTSDVLNEVLAEYAKLGRCFDSFCCIYPCVPFLTVDIIKGAYDRFVSSGSDALMPVVQYSFPIQRAMKVSDEGFLSYREPENAPKRSQDLEPMYHDVGMFYFYKTASWGRVKTIVPYVMPEERIQDIDTLSDWRMAEIKYKMLMESSGGSGA